MIHMLWALKGKLDIMGKQMDRRRNSTQKAQEQIYNLNKPISIKEVESIKTESTKPRKVQCLNPPEGRFYCIVCVQ